MKKFIVPLVFVCVFVFAYFFSAITAPFIIAAVLAYIFQPIVGLCERVGCPRWLGALLVTVVIVAGVIVFSLYTLPLLYAQLMKLIMKLPVYFAQLKEVLLTLFARINEYVPHVYYDQVQENISAITKDVVPWLFANTQSLFQQGLSLIHYVTLVLLLPVLTFYFMKDWPRLISTIVYYLPPDSKKNIIVQAKEVDRTIAGFARGQATVCLILAMYYGVGLHVVGLDFGFLIGALTGLFAFVPYIGAIVGFSVAATIAWLQFSPWLFGDSGSWALFGVVTAVFALGQFIEGAILSPNVVGRSIRLHPLWIVFALFFGGHLFGLVGVLVATPVAGSLGVILRHALIRYRQNIYKTKRPRNFKKTFISNE
jgi:predicted PurR-regulated permease PerM